jgi:hypothetical protein
MTANRGWKPTESYGTYESYAAKIKTAIFSATMRWAGHVERMGGGKGRVQGFGGKA